jgi:sugar/nucleoside kinase (ribokinase family)
MLDPTMAAHAAEGDEALQYRVVSALLSSGVRHVVMTLGSKGVLYGHRRQEGHDFNFVRFDALSVEPSAIRNVHGAGDSLVGATVAAMVANAMTLEEAIPVGIAAAKLSVESDLSVSPHLTPDAVDHLLQQARQLKRN